MVGNSRSEDPSLAGLPELRSSPPWVMEEMIQAQPTIPAGWDDHDAGLESIAAAVVEAARAGRLVTLVGCGTSEHGALGVAELMNESLERTAVRRPAVVARQALEAALDPWGETVCIGVSHEGGTAATIAAMRAARDGGALTGLITARPDAPAGGIADHVMHAPLRDESYCHTVGYVSPIVAGGLLAGRVRNSSVDRASISACLRAALEERQRISAVADALDGIERALSVGSGVDRVSARELALKIEEGVRLPANAVDLETLLHGHLVSCESSTAVVLFLVDPRMARTRIERAQRLLTAANRLGVRTTAIVNSALADEVGAFTTAGHISVSTTGTLSPVLETLLGGAVKLQLLTLELVMKTGHSPDLIRREQTPYREAAAIVESMWP